MLCMAVPTGTSLCMQSESQMLLTSELSVGELSTSVAHCVLRHQAVSCLALAAAHAISTHAASYTAANDPRQAAFRHSKSSICQAKMWSVSAFPQPSSRQAPARPTKSPDSRHSSKCLPGWHQLAAGMPPIARKPHTQGCRGSDGSHHPQLQALSLQKGPLLYVQLHKGADRACLDACALQDGLRWHVSESGVKGGQVSITRLEAFSQPGLVLA